MVRGLSREEMTASSNDEILVYFSADLANILANVIVSMLIVFNFTGCVQGNDNRNHSSYLSQISEEALNIPDTLFHSRHHIRKAHIS